MPLYPTTNKKVHEQLQSVFKEGKEKGLNPRAIAETLLDEQNHEVDPRTIYNYMRKPAGKASIKPDTLQALCHVLLKCSYDAAIRAFNPDSSKAHFPEKYSQYLHSLCGKINILEMNQPMSAEQLFVEPTFLPEPRSRMGYHFARLLPNRLVHKPSNETISSNDVLERFHNILVLGLPGAGKTTWLKHLAWSCLNQPLHGKVYFPVYCELQRIAPHKHETLIHSLFAQLSPYLPNVEVELTERLDGGEVMMLLDGLDRVAPRHLDFIHRGIDELVRRFPKSRFIMARRTKATSKRKFQPFSEVELSGLAQPQIETLATNWFKLRAQLTTINQDDEPVLKTQNFIHQLHENTDLEQLAANPLLTIFLLIVSEDRSEPIQRKLLLCQRVTRVLTEDWNQQQHNTPYISMPSKSVDHRMYKDILSLIAYSALCQHRRELEAFRVGDCVHNFLERIGLDADPCIVVRELEAKYGILLEFSAGHYTFQHSTLQEFFAMRYIVQQGDVVLEQSINQYFVDPFFQEVFPLVADRLANCDRMLHIIADYIQAMVKDNVDLNRCLQWLEATTELWQGDRASSGWAALLLALDVDLPLYTVRLEADSPVDSMPFHDLATAIQTFNRGREQTTRNTGFLNIALWLVIIYSLAQDKISELLLADPGPTSDQGPQIVPLKQAPDYVRDVLEVTDATTLTGELDSVIAKAEEINERAIAQLLRQYQDRLPQEHASVEVWQDWAEDLRQVMVERFNIGHARRMSLDDHKVLADYVYSNNLLLRCIRESSTSTFSLRNELVDQMLMPYKEPTPQPIPATV